MGPCPRGKITVVNGVYISPRVITCSLLDFLEKQDPCSVERAYLSTDLDCRFFLLVHDVPAEERHTSTRQIHTLQQKDVLEKSPQACSHRKQMQLTNRTCLFSGWYDFKIQYTSISPISTTPRPTYEPDELSRAEHGVDRGCYAANADAIDESSIKPRPKSGGNSPLVHTYCQDCVRVMAK